MNNCVMLLFAVALATCSYAGIYFLLLYCRTQTYYKLLQGYKIVRFGIITILVLIIGKGNYVEWNNVFCTDWVDTVREIRTLDECKDACDRGHAMDVCSMMYWNENPCFGCSYGTCQINDGSNCIEVKNNKGYTLTKTGIYKRSG